MQEVPSAMSVSNVSTWVIISIVVLFLLLIPGIDHGLWGPDEPRVAGICAGMARTNDYIVPHLNGKPFLEKPPLYYAVAAVSGSLLSVGGDVPYRLVSLLFAVLTIIAACAIASHRDGVVTGIIAGGILASSVGFFMLSRQVQVDIALVFGVVLAMYAYLEAVDSSSAKYSIVLGFAVGISFMAKGFIGPALIAASIMIDTLRRRNLAIVWRIKPQFIIMCMGIIVVPWIIALWDRGGWAFLREAIVVNNLMRFTGAPEGAALGHQHGPLYYFIRFPLGFLPWTLLFIPAFISSLKNFRNDPYLSWFIGPFLLLAAASTKRGIYLVPLYPAAACMTAQWFAQARYMKWDNFLVKITWGIAVAGCFVPFAGIFLGIPVTGLILAILALSSMALITRFRMKHIGTLPLVLIMSIALTANAFVYYTYMKPHKDYLGFARQAMAIAGSKEIVMLSPNEAMRGVLPLVTGNKHRVVSSPDDIRENGIYIWADKDDSILRSLKQRAGVEILLERKMIYSGCRTARLAIISGIHGSDARSRGEGMASSTQFIRTASYE